MNYYERHLGDYSKDTAHLTMIEHGAYGLLLDRYYSTETGIPADQVHRIARARTKEEKAAVDIVLKEYFKLIDGIWINIRAEEEIAKANVKIYAAKENGKRGGRPKKSNIGSENETQQKPSGLFIGSENETQQKAHQTPDTRHQSPKDTPEITRDDFPVTREGSPSPAGLACKAMIDSGINPASVNPSHPDLLALIEAGSTEQEFADSAREAAARGKASFSYVLGMVRNRRAESRVIPSGSQKGPKPENFQKRDYGEGGAL